MFCPNCGYEQKCGCKACKKNFPTDLKTEIWTPDGNGISCANCGFTMSADWWERLDYDICKSLKPDLFGKPKVPNGV